MERWRDVGDTHQREHVEGVEAAVKAETRARRIARAGDMVQRLPARRTPR
jgi:hypothetical protein